MNCHYVPKFYLNNFSIPNKNGRIFAYRRNEPVFETSTASIANKNDIYIFIDKNGKKNKDIEEMFSQLEGDCKPIIDKIIINDKLTLTDEEKKLLANFISFLHTRNLSFMAKQKNTYSTGMKKILELQAIDKEVFKNNLKQSNVKVDLNNEEEIEELRESILNFDKLISPC